MGKSLADKPWLKNYDEGVPPTIEVPDHPLHHFLEQAAKNYPEHTAIIFKDAHISYQTLNQQAELIAVALQASGFRKGDRAVIYMPNCPQFVITYYGILKAGGIVSATNPLYSERELSHQLADTEAETVFVLSLFYEKLKSVQAHTKVQRIIVTNIKEYLPPHIKVLFTLFKEKKEGHRVTLKPGDMWFQDFLKLGQRTPKVNVSVTGDDIALLQYTGGTTGVSKGAIGTHRNLVSNTLMARTWIRDWSYASERILTAIPLFHSYGMIGAMSLGISAASTLILVPNPRDQADLLKNINKHHPTMFPGVPSLYVAINNNPDVVAGKYDLKSIRYCLSGSAPLMMETQQQFEKISGAKLVEAYGLSEAHVATHINRLHGPNRVGSIGLPLPNIECRVVDINDSSKDLTTGEIGELVIRGPNIMQGYWRMPTETQNALRDGWLFTGDIVECDEDGYFYIRDRKKDMIIAGGYNVYPREVEEVLIRHSAVKEAAVAGIPDPKRGETVVAWVVLKPGATITPDALIEWSKEELAAYKYPRIIEFVPELPKSTVLKVLKRELVRQYLEKQTAAKS